MMRFRLISQFVSPVKYRQLDKLETLYRKLDKYSKTHPKGKINKLKLSGAFSYSIGEYEIFFEALSFTSDHIEAIIGTNYYEIQNEDDMDNFIEEHLA